MKLNFRDLLALWEHAVSRLTAIFPTKNDLQQGVEQIMAKQSDIVTQLNRAFSEIRTKIDQLQAAVENQENATPELTEIAQQLDDIVPGPNPEPPVNS